MEPIQYQGVAAVDSPNSGIAFLPYKVEDKERYEKDVARGALETGTKILDSKWLDTPVFMKKIEELTSTFNISKMPVYQGTAVIDDTMEGPCITFYTCAMKGEYDQDVSDGKQPDGRQLISHEWVNEPMNFDGINEIAGRLFQQSF